MMNTTQCYNCLICAKQGKSKKDTLYFNYDQEKKSFWVFCCRENKSYSLEKYCQESDISLSELLKQQINLSDFTREVNTLEFPNYFIPLNLPEAEPALKYLNRRKILPHKDLYYDTFHHGIAMSYWYKDFFCGAQTRLIDPQPEQDKIVSLKGTKKSLLFGLWDQKEMPNTTKIVFVFEGMINALSMEQLIREYSKTPEKYRCISMGGSGISQFQLETLKELSKTTSITLVPDPDEAGQKMVEKVKLFKIDHKVLNFPKDLNDLLIDGLDLKAILAMGSK